jgi:hypothetical protein
MNRLGLIIEADELRTELVRSKRRRVDALRVTHERLRRELEALDNSPSSYRSQRAVDAMRAELQRCTAELRQASRELVKSI